MKRLKIILNKCIYLLLIDTFIIAGILLFLCLMEEYEVQQMDQHLHEEKEELEKTDFDFSPLMKQNPDMAGWLEIEGTNIDYPIVQGNDNEYYLTHDFYREDSKAGAIFMDYRNSKDLSDPNTILYGHNMKDGTMFQNLNKYNNLDFIKEHRYINLYSGTTKYIWEIFCTYSVNTDFNYLITEFSSMAEYQAYLKSVLDKSQYHEIENSVQGGRILTLSTCSSCDQRRVVHARLVGEEKQR